MNKKTIRLGTWNVRTMLPPGKMSETAREMRRYKIEILAIQETRWSGKGKIDKTNYTLYYAGEKKQGKNGTAFLVGGGIRNKIMQYEAVDGRISWIRIENKQANITIINAYAPTENSKEEEKTKFYDKLEKVCEKVKRNDILMIVGDFNAKIGKEERNEGVAGKETIHDTTNDNGAKICDLAAATNTFIVSTQYRHKREHKITWMIPGGTEGNQIDHMLISKKWKRIIQDVRTYRGANVDSDHLLVVAKMRAKVVKQTGGSRKNGWDVEKLNHTRHNDEYKKEMRKKLETREEEVDIDEEWKNLKESIIDTAETVLGRRTTRKRKEWFDEECEKRTEAKNQARNRWLMTGNLKDLENYKEKRKEATKYCKHKKESWIGELMQEVEVNNRDSRKLYKLIKHWNSTSKKTQRIGNKRWETYYTELFREEKEITGRKKEKVEMEDSNNEDDAPSYDEYMEIIAQLKTKKAAGPDQISNELIKQGGHELLSRVYRILVAVWQSEIMPEEWRTGLLIPLLKKGDPTQCNNYRGIMLLNTTYKILTSIIRKRLAEHTETKLGEYQNGFRKGKSTIDAIHVMSQIIEKSYEYDIELHILFIDFKQAFDNINRRSLVEQMQQMKIPEKLIKLTKMTMDNSKARISTTEGVTNEINIERGVRQGDALSTTLFNIALDGAIKAAGLDRAITVSATQVIAYADDIALITRDKKSLGAALQKLVTETEKRGLQLNQDKTKYMIISRRKTDHIKETNLGSYTFKKVENFKYLGVNVNEKNERSAEIKERIQAANKAYWKYQRYLTDHHISRATKIKIYKAAIRPVATYAAETMRLTNTDEENLGIFERKVLRKIAGPRRTEEGEYRILMNHEIRDIIEGEDIVGFVKAQRLRWFGHVQRRDTQHILRKTLNWRPVEGRPRGRPRIRWEDQIHEDIRRIGIEDWRNKIQDRKSWEKNIRAAREQGRI
jgi:endonuclease/exonuclease/phosphatase family metal-dependent hydrolase